MDTKKPQHTPTPWHLDSNDPEADIHSAFGMVARTTGHPDNQDEEGSANAALIVEAVNAHDALTERVAELERLLGEACEDASEGAATYGERAPSWVFAARAILAKVKHG